MEFSYKSNYFYQAIIISLALHLLIMQTKTRLVKPLQFSVIQAPNSIEVMIIEEEILPETVVITPEEILTTEALEEPLPEIITPEIVEVRPPIEPKIPETSEQQFLSIKSLGVTNEAKPLAHMNPAPEYPHIARRRGWEGIVLLKIFVNQNGHVDRVTLDQSSGYSTLDNAAISAVRKWQFEPARKNSERVQSNIVVPIRFKLIPQ